MPFHAEESLWLKVTFLPPGLHCPLSAILMYLCREISDTTVWGHGANHWKVLYYDHIVDL